MAVRFHPPAHLRPSAFALTVARVLLGLSGCGDAGWMRALFCEPPHATPFLDVASALLGKLRPFTRTRGVYAFWPTRAGSGPDAQLYPHTDGFGQLNFTVYLTDVPPRCAGLTLWPASHEALYHRGYAHASNPHPQREDYGELCEELAARIPPVEVVGEAGTTIFWHGRSLHSSGISTGGSVRFAVFGDLQQDRPVVPDTQLKEGRERGEPGAWLEQFKAVRPFVTDGAPASDMFADWAV